MKTLSHASIFIFIAFSLLGQQPVIRDLSCSASSGSGSTYTCSIPVTPAGYVSGQEYRFKADTSNTGAATINFNSIGAIAIKKVAGGITTALAAGDIQSGQWVYLTYDGTNMQMASQLGNAGGGGGSGTVTSIVVSSPLTGGTITTSGSIGCPTASGSQTGCISSSDWTTFNSKQSSLTLPLSVANGGTGTATPGLVQGTNITITGSWPNQTITASATGATAFSALTGSTNTSAAMLVGAGASLGATGSGSITATAVPGGGITGSNSIPAGTLPLATTSAFGAVKCDGSTITCTAGVIASIGGGSNNWTSGAGVPTANCTPGTGTYLYFDTAFTNLGQPIYYCSASNVWTQEGVIGGSLGLLYTGTTLDINTAAVPLKTAANTMSGAETFTGGFTQGSETVSFTSTPTFSSVLGTSTITLTGNITSFTLAAASLDGQEKVINFCQNGTGGFTAPPPSNVHGLSIGTTASKCSSWVGRWNAGQSAWLAIGGVNNQ